MVNVDYLQDVYCFDYGFVELVDTFYADFFRACVVLLDKMVNMRNSWFIILMLILLHL